MRAPDSFVARLARDFDGRLRIRWSVARQEFHIEQQVGRAALPPIRISEIDDDLIRAKDGYSFVCAVRPGDRMPCPQCHLTLKVPILSFGEVRCDYCRTKQRDGRWIAGYFPLDDILLEHLRSIDPDRSDPYARVRALDNRNAQLERARQRSLSNEVEAATFDNFNRLVGIQSVGYTGKVFQ